MHKEFDADRLDLRAFAQAGAVLSAQDALSRYARLAQEAAGDAAAASVAWTARGEEKAQAGGGSQVWLHLQARGTLPLTCQRCLGPVAVDVTVDRPFRFVTDEATAAGLDDESEEDVLVLDRAFDLRALVEDELLMALPLVPRHEACPVPVPLAASDAAFDKAQATKANPFAALANLKAGKSGA